MWSGEISKVGGWGKDRHGSIWLTEHVHTLAGAGVRKRIAATSVQLTRSLTIVPSGRSYIISRSVTLRLGCDGDSGCAWAVVVIAGGVMDQCREEMAGVATRSCTTYAQSPRSRSRQHTHHCGGGGLAAGAAGGVVRRHRARQHLDQLERAGGEERDGHLLG